MAKHQRLRFVATGLILLVVSGCATRPIAKEYRKAVAAEDVTFPIALQNPDAYIGDVVLWGGRIIETKTIHTGTQIIVLQMPLGEGERPEHGEYSRGRFIVRSSKFLDPEIYRRGKKITMAGVVSGKETLPLGDTTYTYPVVMVKQLHLWKQRRYYAYPYDYGWGPYWTWGPYWGWGPGPYWGWGPPFEY